MYYHQKQYATSTAILEDLFCNVRLTPTLSLTPTRLSSRPYISASCVACFFFQIEPIEEGLAIKICFLLLDNYITLQQPEKASKPLEFLDKLEGHIEVLDSGHCMHTLI